MMKKKRIVIAGGGFAGCEALRELRRLKKHWADKYEVLLIDRKKYSEFLPLLPDLISGRVTLSALQRDLRDLSEKAGAQFIEDEIRNIDLNGCKVNLQKIGQVSYDHLIIALGAEVDLFGRDDLRQGLLTLYSCSDALKIREEADRFCQEKGYLRAVIVGGGYTGIEIAANIRVLAKKKGVKDRITIIEKSEDILFSTPDWVRKACRRKLEKLGIEIVTGDELESISGRGMRLASGRVIEDTLGIWSAGVKPSSCIDEVSLEKERKRVKVSSDLRPYGSFSGEVFVCGDPAAFMADGTRQLRMAVMFSMRQGKTAARNLVHGLKGRAPETPSAFDPGYLVPFATGSAYGPVMGMRIGGYPGFLLHYFMCFYRSAFTNKGALFKNWLSSSMSKNSKGGEDE